MFTGLLTGRRQAKRALELSIAASEELITLRSLVRELEDRHATLEKHHMSLRGKVYAAGSPATSIPDSIVDTREERKRRALASLRNSNGAIMPPGHE
jgi:hypothetical protein